MGNADFKCILWLGCYKHIIIVLNIANLNLSHQRHA